jgi:hypothetical protein
MYDDSDTTVEDRVGYASTISTVSPKKICGYEIMDHYHYTAVQQKKSWSSDPM